MKKPKPATTKPVNTTPISHQYILDFIDGHPKESYNFKVLARKLQVSTKDQKIALAQLLQNLTKADAISVLADGTFQSSKGQTVLTGKVEFVNARFAYVVPEVANGEVAEDIKVTEENLNQAFDGDTVKLRLFTNRKTRKTEGEVLEVITRRRTEFVGRLEITGLFGFVTPDNKRTHFDIYVGKDDLKNAKNGDKVIVSIVNWGTRERSPVGTVTSVLGAAGENNTEMNAIMAEFGLPVNFPKEVENEAEDIDPTITAEEISKRKDFRSVLTFTIDPIDAKDFDDAISFKILTNGNFEIGVHIADVTHYVLPNTKLEREAYHRATSVYLVDRVIPMLPEALSNNLCSLRPHEDKLTFSAVFEVESDGTVLTQWFGRTIIHSDHRFSYEDAQDVLDGVTDGPYKAELTTLNQIAHKLKDARFKAGSIGFESPEVKFVLDANGVPLKVVPKIRKDAHKLVEEYMLMANKKVAEYVYNLEKGKNRLPMVYRIHEAPNTEKLRVFSAFAKKFGYSVSLQEPKMADSLNSFITALEGKPEQDVLQNLAIRTMSKARYGADAIGHFGLAFAHYSHFTSPIRRYPDMMCHRLLQQYLIDKDTPANALIIEEQARHSSDMEKRAAEAERASVKYKQVEFMQLQREKVFAGIVSGVTEWGFYVEITATKCEGLVRSTDLHDDYYELDKENYRLVGQRHRRIIAFGDSVEVMIKATNLEKRTIDLKLVDEDLNKYSTMARSKTAAPAKATKRKY